MTGHVALTANIATHASALSGRSLEELQIVIVIFTPE
jgi:hypothetical protein